jgi:hypothetical protein
MNRRRFLTALGTSAGATSLVLGSGAYTTVSAQRTVSVNVADDFRAFLQLEPLTKEGINDEPTGRSETPGRTVVFDIPGIRDGENPDASGVAPDSIYEFRNLLEITNQGTQPVTVRSEYNGELADVVLVDADGDVLRSDPPTLDVGDDGINVGLQINTHGAETKEYDETITIIGERVGGNRN